MKISELKSLAQLLMFDMKVEEYKTLQKEFDIILKQMDLIGEINNIEKVEPMTFPYELDTLKLREDVIVDRLSTEDIIVNASTTKYDMVSVPKVVE